MLKLGLAGDTMLGRGVADRLAFERPESLFSPELVEVAHEADFVILNLECAVSVRGSPWPDPSKAFFFRAPPVAVQALTHLGVACVTLANNHALDFGEDALLDTLSHLTAAGIKIAGAGPDVAAARAPAVLEESGVSLAVVGVTDHPAAFAASVDRAGVAFADLWHGVPGWLLSAVTAASAKHQVLVAPHWGPNMTAEPVQHVRSAAQALVEAGATLVAGHSAHVFHGVSGRVLYDLGDFIDDYATHPMLRNDLGLFFLVTLDERGPVELEAVPIELDYCRTRLAAGAAAAWIMRRFRSACRRLGTDVVERQGRLVVIYR
jgi:Bacterial capsule synthesis protein PGA_cap